MVSEEPKKLVNNVVPFRARERAQGGAMAAGDAPVGDIAARREKRLQQLDADVRETLCGQCAWENEKVGNRFYSATSLLSTKLKMLHSNPEEVYLSIGRVLESFGIERARVTKSLDPETHRINKIHIQIDLVEQSKLPKVKYTKKMSADDLQIVFALFSRSWPITADKRTYAIDVADLPMPIGAFMNKAQMLVRRELGITPAEMPFCNEGGQVKASLALEDYDLFAKKMERLYTSACDQRIADAKIQR